jgi:hypothetical protein
MKPIDAVKEVLRDVLAPLAVIKDCPATIQKKMMLR